MTYEEFLDNMKDKDYILIKLSGEFPYFVEKVFVKDGQTHSENNYHIADGMFTTYINYEMPDGGISAEISHWAIEFEVTGDYDCPVYILNTSDKTLAVRVMHFDFITHCAWYVKPNDIVGIYPKEEVEIYDALYFKSRVDNAPKEQFLSQDTINRLLSGEV